MASIIGDNQLSITVAINVGQGGAMFRISLISIFLVLFLTGAPVLGAQQDYVDQLIKLSELSSNQQYREAISGYKRLESQPGLLSGSKQDVSMRSRNCTAC
jgi:hypothetical protein